jgi:hypothetical protein
MEREHSETTASPIELGSVSGDTQGDGGFYWEIGGLQPHPGISND